MDPIDFLELAHRFIFSNDEAERRTAISRAYYYVYHYVKQALVGTDFLAHDKMIDCIREGALNGEKVEEFEILASSIGDLKTDRKFADYDIHKQLNQKTCFTMIKRCQEAIKAFEECKKIGLISAARSYLKKSRSRCRQ